MEDHVLIASLASDDCLDRSGLLEQHLILRVEASPDPRPHRSRTRAQLASWQVKLAREMMLAQIPCGLALADVAARLNLSVNHFIRAFREAEGVSPYHWFLQSRIARSMTLLREDVPLSTVATECGFADQSHFTKAFTRFLGVPPGRWRRGLRDSETGSPVTGSVKHRQQ